MAQKQDLLEKLRFQVVTTSGRTSEEALQHVPWAIRKMMSLGPNTNKTLQLSDGTIIRLDWKIPETPRIIVQVPEFGPAPQKRIEQRELRNLVPVPVLVFYSTLPIIGNNYYARIPEKFILFPWLKALTYKLKPHKPELLNPKAAARYDLQDLNFLHGQVNGDFWEDARPESQIEVRISELWNVGTYDNTNISSSGVNVYDNLTYDPPDSNTNFDPPVHSRVVDDQALSSSWLTEFGTQFFYQHAWHGISQQHFEGGISGFWVPDMGSWSSSGEEVYFNSAASTKPGIRAPFSSVQSVYLFIYRKDFFNYFEEGPEIATTWAPAAIADVTNLVPNTDQFYMRVVIGGSRRDYLLWEQVVDPVLGHGSAFIIDQGIFDFYGTPVVLCSIIKTLAGVTTPMIMYAMVFRDTLYISRDYPQIGFVDYPHLIGKETFYASGYVRCAAMEKSSLEKIESP